MRFTHDDIQAALVDEVDAVLAEAGDIGHRAQLSALGAAGLLAVHWPKAFGGRGLRLADHAAVSERVGLHGLPDEVHLVSIQGVGCTILATGDERQRAAWLPRLAGGQCFASLLFSEQGAGTDLAGIETVATRTSSGFRLDGEKAWNLYADWSGLGVCSARTRSGPIRTEGLSLFLVDLQQAGVSLTSRPRAAGGEYFTVRFDGVEVDEGALLGRIDHGWALMLRAIGFERIGLDYAARAQRWLAAARRLPGAEDGERRVTFLRHERAIAQARALAYRAADLADGLDPDEVACALSKSACAAAAQEVAWWAASELLPTVEESTSAAATELAAAIYEAPELGISGGATDLQFDLIAHSR